MSGTFPDGVRGLPSTLIASDTRAVDGPLVGWAGNLGSPSVRSVGIALTGVGAASAAMAAWLLLRLKEDDYIVGFDGQPNPAMLKTQHRAARLAILAVAFQGVGGVLIAVS